MEHFKEKKVMGTAPEKNRVETPVPLQGDKALELVKAWNEFASFLNLPNGHRNSFEKKIKDIMS